MSAEHEASVFIIPKSLVFGAIMSVVVAIGSGGYYMGTQAANQINGTSSFDKFRIEVMERFARNEASSKASDESTAKIDLRLTRIESQLTFVVSMFGQTAGSRK